METVRVGRNDLCPCGSGRKFKRCCQNQSAAGGTGRITAFEKARPMSGDGAEAGRYSPQPALRQREEDGQPIERIPIHYTYAEPFGDAECVYCFPVEQLFLLEDGSVLPAAWLQPGMQFRLEDDTWGTVTAVKPPRVWEPPSRTPNRDGNYARRVLGRVKHKGYVVLDVTFGGTTVTTTPNHLFYSANRGEWVPIGSMRPGELLRGESGVTSPILAISPPRHGFIELYGIEVEEFHTYFVGGEGGSALVHNGMGDCFKKPLGTVWQ
jgi:SEC-C motif/Pretoxin HINT domain